MDEMDEIAEIKHLRELLKLQEQSFRDQMVAFRKEWKIQEDANRTALLLQSEEYSRRLEGLNHESSRIKEAAEKAVSFELYQADQRALTLRFADLERRQGENKEALLADIHLRAGQAMAWAKIAAFIAIVLPIASFLVYLISCIEMRVL